MKKYLSIIFLFLLPWTALILTTCSKDEDNGTPSRETIIHNLNNEISSDTLRSLVTWLQDMGTRFALSDNHRDVAIKIRDRFTYMGYTNSKIDSFLIDVTYRNITYAQWQYNVVAALEGNTFPDSICIVGGHYDDNLLTGDPFSTDPGANDNASGVAAAMELARVMKKNNYSPQNTIEFIAFGSEELGLFGSRAYASDAAQNAKKIKMMLNYDMIAYETGINQSDWRVNIIDYDNSHNLRTEAEQLCSSLTVLTPVNDNTYSHQSDSYPFCLNGYKTIFFMSDILDPNYHSLNDLAVNCNFGYCREIVKISCALLVNNN